MKTAEDFNREEEARLAKLKAEKLAQNGGKEEKKPPKKNKEGRFICGNKGCMKRTFIVLDNEAEENPC